MGFGIIMYIIITVRDKNGKIILKRKRVSKSALSNYLKWIRSWLTITTQAGYPSAFTMVDTSGTARNYPKTVASFAGHFGRGGSPTSLIVAGIIFGSGDDPVNPDNYKLDTPFTQGSGVGSLLYYETNCSSVTVDDMVSGFLFERQARNDSGGNQSITEVACYFETVDSGGSQRIICMVRDLLDTPITLAQGQSITASYLIQATA